MCHRPTPVIDDRHDIWQGLLHPATRESAMRAFIEVYGVRLHARIRSIIGEVDADDVFQDVLIKVVQGAARFEGNSAFGTWCYRVATNECLDVLRQRSRRPSLEDLPDTFNHHRQAETALPESAILERLVGEAMEALSPQQRLVFEERYFHETPYAELAVRFAKSEGALKANFHHAVRKVSEYLRVHVPIPHA